MGGNQDLAEGLHQAGAVLARVAAAVAHPLELVEAAHLDLELQRGPALAAGQRHQQSGIAAIAAGRFDLAADKVDRALTVGRQYVIGEAGEIHGCPWPRAGCDADAAPMDSV